MSGIDESLMRKTVSDLREVGASIQSHGNPAVMDSFKDPPSLFSLVMMFAGLSLVAYIIAEISNYMEIRRNWAHYRCMPSVTPFAKLYGHDFAETMNFCMSQAVREHAPGVIDPIYAEINKITGVVDGVYDKVSSTADGVTGLLSGLNKFIVGFMNSFRLVGVRVRMTFLQMKSIMDRIYGIFMAFAFAGISAITFGENLACNPLVVFMGEITGVDVCCFAPNTGIRMLDGTVRAIRHIRFGDVLQGGAAVTAIYEFDGTHTKMVRIGGVHVSENHYVFDAEIGLMVHARDHVDAVPAESLNRIWCLATSTNRIPVATTTVAPTQPTLDCMDYEESSDPIVQAEAQRIAETVLNSQIKDSRVLSFFEPDVQKLNPNSHHAKPQTQTHKHTTVVGSYSLGMSPFMNVLMRDGGWKSLINVRIGDVLHSGGVVYGVVREQVRRSDCVELVPNSGILMSKAQLVWSAHGQWRRIGVGTVLGTNENTDSNILLHLFVTNNEFVVGVPSTDLRIRVRDYAEVSCDAIQEPYDRAVTVKATEST